MARVTCRGCYAEYDDRLGACPNCGLEPTSFWRRAGKWRWPWPLAVGVILAALSDSHAADRSAVLSLVMISRFITEVVVFTLITALLMFAVWRARRVWRRRSRRIRRRLAKRRAVRGSPPAG